MKIGSSALLLLMTMFGAEQLATAAETTNDHAKDQTPLSEKEVLQLQVKTQTLINILVQKGIIDAETARALNNKADKEAAKRYGEVTDVVPESKKDEPAISDPNIVRVPYVSKSVRDQIRNEVQSGVETDVIAAVMKKAETERWGVPNSWPSWLQKIKLSGDVRFRSEFNSYADDNSIQYPDILAINKAGGTIPAGNAAFINTSENSERLRLRARLGINVAVAQDWDLGMRLATGGTSPVSTNITVTNYMTDTPINLDRAYVSYKTPTKTQQLWVGRFANPFLSTDLVWDEDVNFNGVAGSYAPWRDTISDEGGIDPYITIGAFPIEQVELGSDKWLYAAQTGFNYEWENQNTLKVGLAYYDYQNIEGKFNTFGSNLLDYTAPKFVQKGNTLFDIRNDDKTNTQLAALASDYNEVDLTLVYDLANFSPTHIIMTLDFVRNIGFNAKENLLALEKSSALDFGSKDIKNNVDGYLIDFLVGWPKISKNGDWNIELGYKYLEGDAVLDAFTDSDFHLGGTDGSGFILTGQYGITDNVGIKLRLLSGNEIHGAPLGVDTWQLDFNVRF